MGLLDVLKKNNKKGSVNPNNVQLPEASPAVPPANDIPYGTINPNQVSQSVPSQYDASFAQAGQINPYGQVQPQESTQTNVLAPDESQAPSVSEVSAPFPDQFPADNFNYPVSGTPADALSTDTQTRAPIENSTLNTTLAKPFDGIVPLAGAFDGSGTTSDEGSQMTEPQNIDEQADIQPSGLNIGEAANPSQGVDSVLTQQPPITPSEVSVPEVQTTIDENVNVQQPAVPEVEKPAGLEPAAENVDILPPMPQNQNTDPEKKKEDNLFTKIEGQEMVTTVLPPVFVKVAFLGLENLNEIYVSEVEKMCDKFIQEKRTFILDTNKNVAQNVLRKLTDSKSKSVGVYLKAYMSDESDLSSSEADLDANITVVQSNDFDKYKQLFREAQLFIALPGFSLRFFTEVLSIWSVGKIYNGHSKPLILFGEEWSLFTSILKQQNFISEKDLEVVNIVRSFEEFVTTLDRLESVYMDIEKARIPRVIDRRVEGDEENFIMN